MKMRCAPLSLLAMLAAATLTARSVPAWEGHDWEQWRLATASERPQIESPQAGLEELLPLLRSEGPESPLIDSIGGWEKKRDRVLGVLGALLGEPSGAAIPTPEAEVLGEEDLGEYTRKHLRIRSETDDWIPAYLLVPKEPRGLPCPTMIVLHQTVAQGKEEPCGIKGDPELAFAVELAKRGFICLAPDAIGFGERIPAGAQPYSTAGEFYVKHPKWSFFGKMSWDISRIVDWLVTQPEIDPWRIGAIGHSHGGYGTIMATAMEPRISAAVASCAFTSLRKDDHPERWSHLTALAPRIGFYVDDIKSAPIDWHEIISTIAPRPFFDWMPIGDANFPNTENMIPVFRDLMTVYGFYGATERLEHRRVPGGHSFPRPAREAAYGWLERMLPPRPNLAKPPADRKAWEALRPKIRAHLERDIGPTFPRDLPNTFEILSSREFEGYREEKIRYAVAPEESINAYLLTPAGPAGSGAKYKRPGAVVFHQTANEGKEEAAGHAGRPSMHIGPELARRGYVILIPDSICAGERITASGAYDTRDFYEEHPFFSAMGKMIQDGRRAVSVLAAAPGVDANRIGAVGHSLGAEEALFVAAFDERVKAAVSSCGFAPFAAEKNMDRWARARWFSYMPRLRVDLRAGRLPAWDLGDVISLVAPRGTFNFQTTEDEIFPEGEAIGPVMEEKKAVWKLYGEEGKVRSLIEPGPHDFSATAKEAAYAWLDSILKQ